MEYKDFVLKFFKKYIKLPRLNQEDVTRMDNQLFNLPQSDLDFLIQSLASNYLKTLQLVYDLMPIVAALECDPYIEKSKEITSFLEKYNNMQNTIANEIVTRAWIEQISKNIPRYE